MIIGKSYHFDAAHSIPGHKKCGEVHGHTWTVEVEVEGSIQKDGMVMDFAKLDSVVKEELSKLDHKLLNHYIDIPTCEVLATHFFTRLRTAGLPVVKITVREGEGGWAKIIKTTKTSKSSNSW